MRAKWVKEFCLTAKFDFRGLNDIFAARFTEDVAQLVRAPDCGSGGRGFDSRHSPDRNTASALLALAVGTEKQAIEF